MSGEADYDEFGLFEDNATEVGLAWNGPPQVERVNASPCETAARPQWSRASVNMRAST